MTHKIRYFCPLFIVLLSMNTGCSLPLSPSVKPLQSQSESYDSLKVSSTYSEGESSLSQVSDDILIPTIPKAMLDYIGIGIGLGTIKRFAGVVQSDPSSPLSKVRILEGGLVEFEYSSEIGETVVSSIRISDNSGVRTILPIPDESPVEEFVFRNGDITLEIDGVISEEDLNKLGTIKSDATKSGEWEGELGKYRERSIEFERISLVLIQSGNVLQTNRWRIWEMSIKDTGYTNPRGMHVGLSLTETIRKLGTGEIAYDIIFMDEETGSLTIEKSWADEPINEYVNTKYNIEEGKIAEIQIEFLAP